MTGLNTATPLTRFGSRVPAVAARKATTAASAAAVATPAATITSMVICLPDGLPAQALTATALHRHFGVTGTLQPRFWAKPDLWLWQPAQLIGLRKGRPAPCAGGPVKLLDLDGLRHAAAIAAGVRHQIWQQVVHGTRPAHLWQVFQSRHLADPATYPQDRAAADFWNQPRINAMRMHNAAGYGTTHLPLPEVEVFQAGPMAYQHFHATTAVCADALLTADGHKLTPASDALAHRVTYLEQAGRYLNTIEPSQRLLAITF
nr:hypothetical protein [uncultured Actinoplanes sp.]